MFVENQKKIFFSSSRFLVLACLVTWYPRFYPGLKQLIRHSPQQTLFLGRILTNSSGFKEIGETPICQPVNSSLAWQQKFTKQLKNIQNRSLTFPENKNKQNFLSRMSFFKWLNCQLITNCVKYSRVVNMNKVKHLYQTNRV